MKSRSVPYQVLAREAQRCANLFAAGLTVDLGSTDEYKAVLRADRRYQRIDYGQRTDSLWARECIDRRESDLVRSVMRDVFTTVDPKTGENVHLVGNVNGRWHFRAQLHPAAVQVFIDRAQVPPEDGIRRGRVRLEHQIAAAHAAGAQEEAL